MQNHLTYLLNKTETKQAAVVLTEPIIGFYQDLFTYQSRQYDHFINDPRLPLINDKDIPIAAKGKSILSDTVIPDLLLPGLLPLIEIVISSNPGIDLNPLQRALSNDAAALIQIVDAVLDMDAERLDTFALSHKISTDEAIFVITNWLKPFFISLREKGDIVLPDTDDSLFCPFCGNQPDMAALVTGAEGKRHLHCALCENRWAYKRIACAVCGNDDAATLEYLSSEDDPRHRLDVCSVCNGFIKTVRLEKFEDIDECDLTVENILTAHLDSAALRKGYKKP